MTVFLLAILIFFIGLYGVLVKRNLMKIVIGLVIMEYGVNLLFVLIGYSKGGTAPIWSKGLAEGTTMVDPVPQALVLTAIVIGLATTALIASFAVRIYEKHGTMDVRQIRKLKG